MNWVCLACPTALAAKDAELGKMVFSPACSDPMMIKEAVNSPRHRGEMNHSKHHYRLFWTCLRSLPQPALRAREERRSFEAHGLEIFAELRINDRYCETRNPGPGVRSEASLSQITQAQKWFCYSLSVLVARNDHFIFIKQLKFNDAKCLMFDHS